MASSLTASALEAEVRHRLDNKTKPTGSLGRIEDLALRLALALDMPTPTLAAPQMIVFAADHGIAAQGVSAYPSDVTWQMVENFLAGGAAVAVLARQHGLALTVVDCGVRHDFTPRPGLVVAKVAAGSADSLQGPAMTTAQCAEAMANGARIVASLPGNAILLGEMGIGNTSAAALLMARLTGLPIEACAGRGTGLDDAAFARKLAVLSSALQRAPDAAAPLAALADVGGLEIATMVGSILEATRLRRVIVVDGFICTAAVAVAMAVEPGVSAQCVFAHCSAESGHARWLEQLGARALLNLDLRLGEGSGAALAWPLLESACRILAEMASFESAGVSNRGD
jgi:nicotinate-nucleotide--dimethylbenzimidazole phosphoribosyltransferase